METPEALPSPSAIYLSQYSTTELLLIAQSVYETGTAEFTTAAKLLASHALLKQKKGGLGADKCAKVVKAQMTELGIDSDVIYAANAPELLKVARKYYLMRVGELHRAMELEQDRFRIHYAEIQQIQDGQLDKLMDPSSSTSSLPPTIATNKHLPPDLTSLIPSSNPTPVETSSLPLPQAPTPDEIPSAAGPSSPGLPSTLSSPSKVQKIVTPRAATKPKITKPKAKAKPKAKGKGKGKVTLVKDEEEGEVEIAEVREKEPSFSVEIEVKPGLSGRRLSEDGQKKDGKSREAAGEDVEMTEA